MGAWGGGRHNLEITHVDSANSIKSKGERERERDGGGIIWEEKIAAVTRRLSFGSFNSIEMAAAQLGQRAPLEGEGKLGGCTALGAEGGCWGGGCGALP